MDESSKTLMFDMTGFAIVGTVPKSIAASNADVYPITGVLFIV